MQPLEAAEQADSCSDEAKEDEPSLELEKTARPNVHVNSHVSSLQASLAILTNIYLPRWE